MKNNVIITAVINPAKPIDAIKELRDATVDPIGDRMHLAAAKNVVDRVRSNGVPQEVTIYRPLDRAIFEYYEVSEDPDSLALKLILLTGDLGTARNVAILLGHTKVAEALRG